MAEPPAVPEHDRAERDRDGRVSLAGPDAAEVLRALLKVEPGAEVADELDSEDEDRPE